MTSSFRENTKGTHHNSSLESKPIILWTGIYQQPGIQRALEEQKQPHLQKFLIDQA